MPSATLDGSKSSRPAPSGPILAIFPGALGDLICVIPALRAIARRHPEATVELMARAELARFATGRLGCPLGNSAGDIRGNSRDAGGRTSGGSSHGHSRGHSIDRREVAQLFAARSGQIEKEARAFFGSFAHVYSFFAADNEHFRTALAAATDGRASFFPFRPSGAGHVAAAYLREIGAGNDGEPENGTNTSGIEALAALNCSFDLYPEELDLAEDRLTDFGFAAGNFMLILPGSGSKAKNWPVENFVSLATTLIPRIRPLVILGPAESRLEPSFTAAGITVLSQLELAEVAALARLSRCFIGNDSGVSHLAAAAGALGLVLFGPTDPERWRPLGRTRVLQRDPLSAITLTETMATMLKMIDGK
jgi:Glycosyltransferase family 9 (heptosyltransferase)